jgi:hypothetical protein
MEEFVMSDASFEPSPEMVERVAEALYLTAVRSAQERIAARPMPTEKIKAVFEDALAASDREAAIIIFALIDDIATEFFRERLTGKVPNGVEQAFLTGNGLLASGYNKILLLAGLEWIRIETYRELNLIRRVRNEFAHHVEYRAFGDSPIRDYIESMDQSDLSVTQVLREQEFPSRLSDQPLVLKIVDDLFAGGLSSRAKFLIRSCLATARMAQDIEIIQAAVFHRVDPRSLAAGFDSLPDNIKDLMRSVVRLSFRAIHADLEPRLKTGSPRTELPADFWC